jgi:hypothetical protein
MANSKLEHAAKLAEVGTQLAQQAREPDDAMLAWLADLEDGRRIVVYRMLFGNARICIGPANSKTYDDGYCYAGTGNAIVAACLWVAGGGEGEPEGWTKNLQTGETRL